MTDATDRIQQLQIELLEGDRRLQQRIEELGENVETMSRQIVTMAEQQGRHQRQLGEIISISAELYRFQEANQKEIRDLLAVVRRNQDILNQPPESAEE